MRAANIETLCLGVVGAGLMGKGIAQIAVQAGIPVVLHDNRPDAAATAKNDIGVIFEQLVAKGKLDIAQASAALERLKVAASIDELAACPVVVEAIVENLDAKRALLEQLEGIVGEHCILATNTSSLSVTAIAAACQRPGRVAGFHFFSPVPLMKIVEVIDGLLTQPDVGETLAALAVKMGHAAVRAKDTPGFVVNHAGRAYLTESLRLLGENIAPHGVLDDILRQSASFRMGPFELLDLTGLDVSHPAMESIYERFYHDPRFRPSPIAAQRVAAGILGRKTGTGFYTYENGRKKALESKQPAGDGSIPVWVSSADPQARQTVVGLLETLGARLVDSPRPPPEALCLVLPIGQDATTAALADDLDPTRVMALDPLFLDGHRTLMATPLTAPAIRCAAHALLSRDGVPVSVIHDSPGFVAQRVVAAIVNLGCDIAQQNIASPADIDRAVTLGLGYPRGPLAMGDFFGAKTILRILDGLHEFYRDPRYRPCPWLRRRALLGVSLLTPEQAG